MTYGTRTDHYPGTSKLLHWLVAVCVLTTAPVAIAMGRVSAWADPRQSLQFPQVAWRPDPDPDDPALDQPACRGRADRRSGIEPWQKTVSSIVHTSLYVLLFAMPIVGYIANSAYGASTPFFGLFNLPPIVGKNEALSTQLFTIHRWVGWLLIALVLMHVGAALFHYFIRRDNVLQRMLPRVMGGF